MAQPHRPLWDRPTAFRRVVRYAGMKALRCLEPVHVAANDNHTPSNVVPFRWAKR